MNPTKKAQSEVEPFKSLLLEMALKRSVPELLKIIVQRLKSLQDVALARIWLMNDGDQCQDCLREQQCSNRTRCLHLSASAGHSIDKRNDEWNRIDGPFIRNPLGFLRVGKIASTKKPIQIDMVANAIDSPVVGPNSFISEGIVGFTGQPILFKGSVIGVLALFTRAHPNPERLLWLRMIADHAAIAIINAKAFKKIETLKLQLERENAYLHEELEIVKESDVIVGRSRSHHHILDQINLVAPTDANVLILGESGTGKELVAREIHRRSKRFNRRLVRVNCAAIPRDLYESEFFGHKRGAFTGAFNDREGRFALADGGTLFLDEIGEIPYELQSKLLRVLQEGQYEPVGGHTTQTTNVRIIAATNKDLKKAMLEKRFRQDLYYRLNVFPVELDPLRYRKEDISPLAVHFLEIACRNLNRQELKLTQAHFLKLQSYEWPGNARELQNVIERAVILACKGRLEFDLPDSRAGFPSLFLGEKSDHLSSEKATILKECEVRELEQGNLENALIRCGWKIYGAEGAASLIGIKPTTLVSRMKKMGIRKR